MLSNCGVWRRLLRVSWTARRSNQSILKEINLEHSPEGLMLKLKLQYFGHVMERADSLRKDPDAGKDWRLKENGAPEDEMVGWRHQLNGHESEQTPEDSEGQGSLVCCNPWGCRVRHNSETEWQHILRKRFELSFTSWHSTVHCWVFPGFLPCLHEPFHIHCSFIL